MVCKIITAKFHKLMLIIFGYNICPIFLNIIYTLLALKKVPGIRDFLTYDQAVPIHGENPVPRLKSGCSAFCN